MRVLLAAAAVVVSALALSACDKQPAATPAPPVVITVPGPQGPAGAPAEKGETGTTGAQGVKGDKGEGAAVVVPVPAQQR